ncbi:MAG: DUF6452 family protein [Melioribacteraceae bacterium]|nr:DUF6452 family protein [Melioribacteraceae bacterium]
MRKILALILLFIVTINCEKDDICPETTATTPKLIIRFYDITNQTETLRVLGLQVQGVDNEEIYQSAVSTDSLPLPLKTYDITTSFKLHKEYTNDGSGNITGNEDIINIEYNPEEVYVSRACGYKTIFKNVELSVVDDGDNWIELIHIENPLIIDNETAAHVKIFH